MLPKEKEQVEEQINNVEMKQVRLVESIHTVHRYNKRKLDKMTNSEHASSELTPFSGACSLCGAKINGDSSNLRSGHLICDKCKKLVKP